MADPKVVEEWLAKADEDLEFAVSVIEDSLFYAQICFHLHQAAEKYLKSYVIAWNLEFRRIHDLPVLLSQCQSRESSLAILLDDCNFLNRFYIDTRYPVHWPSQYTKEESMKARTAAEHIRDEIRGSLEAFLASVP